jgi:hypothetical protein
MNPWQRRQDGNQDECRVRDTHQRPKPPGRDTEGMKKQDVDRGDPPPVEEMDDEADDLSPVTITGDHGPEYQGRIHTGQVERLTRPKDRGEQARREQSPQQHVTDMHDRLFPFGLAARRCVLLNP